jgi:hypothetical protein
VKRFTKLRRLKTVSNHLPFASGLAYGTLFRLTHSLTLASCETKDARATGAEIAGLERERTLEIHHDSPRTSVYHMRWWPHKLHAKYSVMCACVFVL